MTELVDEVSILRSEVATLQQLLEVLERTALDQTRKLQRSSEIHRFLADSSAVLVASLDYQKTLARVANLAIPAFADWSLVHLIDKDGSLRRVAVAHADPEKAARLNAIEDAYPPAADAGQGPIRVVRTGEPELVETISDEVLAAATTGRQHMEQLRSFGFTSYVSVPLRVHDKTLGSLTFAMAESERHYATADLMVAQQLADRAALAIENSRLFHEVEEARRNLERRVVERTAELQESNQQLEAFSYSVSHDLRAPIRHISGFADLLRKRVGDTLDEVSAHYVNTIANSARYAGTLVDDLLAFSRMGRVELVREHVSMDHLVAQARADVSAETANRKIDWVVQPLGEARGDASMLRLVWRNLIANAVKYSRTRDPAVITIGSSDTEDERIFFVRDNGVGFDMQYVNKLFGVFQRLHRAEEFEGTGIGLANVRRIIARHHGRTWAEGEVGRGATFWFSLPRVDKEV